MDVMIRLSSEIHKQVKICANKEKRTIKATIEIAVAQYLQKQILEK